MTERLPVVLLTGFEPFGGDRFNPSIEIARRLDRWQVRAAGDGTPIAEVRAEELPCVFGTALASLDQAIRRHRPRWIIALGLAGSRSDIGVERIAINVDDARIPDNAGQQPIDVPIRAAGPAAYWSTLPIKAIVAAIRAAGLPASVSQSAGTFVCTHVFYGLAHRLASRRGPRGAGAHGAVEKRAVEKRAVEKRVRGGFIHVPYPIEHDLPGDRPALLTLDAMVDAIRIAVQVAVEREGGDLREGGGAID